jgi:hypothetical protein
MMDDDSVTPLHYAAWRDAQFQRIAPQERPPLYAVKELGRAA